MTTKIGPPGPWFGSGKEAAVAGGIIQFITFMNRVDKSLMTGFEAEDSKAFGVVRVTLGVSAAAFSISGSEKFVGFKFATFAVGVLFLFVIVFCEILSGEGTEIFVIVPVGISHSIILAFSSPVINFSLVLYLSALTMLVLF